MAHGLADDLATAVLLATDRPVLVAPAMNPRMWAHPATRRNVARLRGDGVAFVGPAAGEMAERGEAGVGRMAEPAAILAGIEEHARRYRRAGAASRRPRARHVGSDARADRSRALSRQPLLGPPGPRDRRRPRRAPARHVTLVTGPVVIARSARRRDGACRDRPRDAGRGRGGTSRRHRGMAAAVADWRAASAGAAKIKKDGRQVRPGLRAGREPRHPGDARPPRDGPAPPPRRLRRRDRERRRPRPRQAEAEGADLIVANDVSPATGVMGGTRNRVHLVDAAGVESWAEMAKDEVARRLVALIAERLDGSGK